MTRLAATRLTLNTPNTDSGFVRPWIIVETDASHENLEGEMSLVLIVDEQPRIRELLVNWISREGYQTAQAADAQAALDLMMGRPADVVVCDVQLPGQVEFWLAARLHERFPDTAIILATDDRTVPPVIRLQPGVVVYLAMPFGREAVLKAVRIGLHWHRMSMADRAKKADRTDSIETWLATPPRTEHLQK
jgi:DNA-binding NtrC family response regulator